MIRFDNPYIVILPEKSFQLPMSRLFLILLFIVLFHLSAQGQEDTEYESLQKKVDQFYPQSPDSSIYYLKAALRHIPKGKDSLRIDDLTKLGLSYSYAGDKDSTRHYFNKAVFHAGKYPLLKGITYRKWGKVYRNFGHYAQADSVLNIADSLFKKTHYLSGIGMVLVERATINHYTQNIKKAIEELDEAIKVFKKSNDDDHLLIAKMELAASYLMSDEYTFAQKLYEEVLPDLEKEKNLNYYFTLVNYGDTFFELEKWEEAGEKYTMAYRYFKKNHLRQYEYYVLSKMAEVNHKEGHLIKAKKQFKDAFRELVRQNSPRVQQVSSSYLQLLQELGDHKDALSVLKSVLKQSENHTTRLNANNDIFFLVQASEIYKQNNMYSRALEALERVVFLKDSLTEVNDIKARKEVEAKFRSQRLLHNIETLNIEKTFLQEKAKKNRWIAILFGLLLLLITLSSILIHRKGKEKIRLQERVIEESSEKIIALNKKKELQDELIKERQYNLLLKNREVISLSLQLTDSTTHIKNILKNASKDELPTKISNELKMITNNKNYWKLFNKRFNSLHPNFEQKLKDHFPEFTTNNIEFCKLLKLKLDNKEIAKLTGITAQSVITKKYRLKKKLGSKERELLFEKIIESRNHDSGTGN